MNVNERGVELAYRPILGEIINQISFAENLDLSLIDLKDRILSFFKADRTTIYVVDEVTNEIFSLFKVGNEVGEICLPINTTSFAGYTVLNGTIVNIRDAYDDEEINAIHPDLKFNRRWDVKVGYRTTQSLTVPINIKSRTIGALQLINRTDGRLFTRNDERSAQEIAEILGAKIMGIAIQKPQRGGRRSFNKFDYLVRQNLITQSELEKAIFQAREQKIDTEQALMKNFQVSKDHIGSALSEFYKCPFVEFDEKIPIPGRLLHNLKKSFLQSNLWVPLEERNSKISVLTDDPDHLARRDMVQTLLESSQVQYCVALKGISF